MAGTVLSFARSEPVKKLKLNLDALAVNTFETAAPAGEQGTVMAQQGAASRNGTCWQDTCVADCSAPTYEWTCWDTCACPVEIETRTCV